MDLITHLRIFHGFVTIFVIVDRLSKYTYFISLPPTFKAAKVAISLLKTIADSTIFPALSFRTVTLFLWGNFGENRSNSVAPPSNSWPLTTHKLMARQELLTASWNNTFASFVSTILVAGHRSFNEPNLCLSLPTNHLRVCVVYGRDHPLFIEYLRPTAIIKAVHWWTFGLPRYHYLSLWQPPNLATKNEEIHQSTP